MASGGNGRHVDFDFGDIDVDGAPEYFRDSIGDMGTVEYIGTGKNKRSNPAVERWIEVIEGRRMNAIQYPWCAYWIGAKLEAAGYTSTKSGMARSYLRWGTEAKLSEARPGDILVFWRGKFDDGVTGHIAQFVKQKGKTIYALGGNQGDMVCVQEFTSAKLLSVRRPKSWTSSRTVLSAVGSATAKVTEKTAEMTLPDPEPIQAALAQAKTSMSVLATSKPYIITALAALSIILALYAAWYRINDHKSGRNT